MRRYHLHPYTAKYEFSNEKLSLDTILGKQATSNNSNEGLLLELGLQMPPRAESA